MDAQGNLTFGAGSTKVQMVEVEPGLLQDRDDASHKLVLHTDETGQAYLFDPLGARIKAPWYGNLTLHGLLVVFGLLLFVGTLIGWGIAALIGLRRRQPGSIASRLACWTGAFFGLVLIVLLFGLVTLLSDIDPAYGIPATYFGLPPLFTVLVVLAYGLAGLWVLMLVFASLAWVRRMWNLGGRLHYTLLTLSGLSLVWVLWYWKVAFI
jgi:hypothetical protein